MKKYIFLVLLNLLLTTTYANSKAPINNTLDNDTERFKNETLDSCYNKIGSAYIQNCLIYLASDKKATYTTAFNQFMKKVNQKKEFFFDYKLFVKLIKQAKLDWDKFIKNECLAKATTFKKGSFVYSDVYNRCLILGYESRIKYYEAYQF